MIIKGPTVGTPTPRTNYEQTDPAKADYLKGKDALDKKIQDAQTAATNAKTESIAHTNTQVSGAKTYTNEQVKRAAPFNHLINSNFRNPINTNGKTSYTGAGYSINNWRAYHATTTHTITSDGIKVSATDANAAMYQILDVSKLKTNKKYTAAAMDINGNVSIWTGYITNTSAGAGAVVYVSGSNTLFRIYGANTWVWAALYEGEYNIDTLPEYRPKGYETELFICRQYDPATGAYIGLRKFGYEHNLLVNSDFRNPVNQRNKLVYVYDANQMYTIDGWINNTSGQTVSVVDGGIEITSASAVGILYQLLPPEISKYMKGKTFTLAVCQSDGTVFVASGVCKTEDVTANTSMFVVDCGDWYTNVYKMKSTQLFAVRINTRAGKTVKIRWAALYEGAYTQDTLPEYHPKDRVLEELDCGIVDATELSVYASDFPMVKYRATEGGVITGNVFYDHEYRRHILRSYHSDTDGKSTRYSESYYFPAATAGLTEHKSYSVLTTKNPVSLAQGGTGATSAAGVRNALGLGNTDGALPVANGGTGATTVAGARNALGLGNTNGAVPIANGGTGATTAAQALINLGFNFTQGNATRDTTNTKSASELKYFKFGRIVIARFELAMATTANGSYTTYQVATGFPKASGSARNACHLADANGNGWSCPCEITNTGALRVHVRNAMGGMTVIGSVVYIAES